MELGCLLSAFVLITFISIYESEQILAAMSLEEFSIRLSGDDKTWLTI